ncbi:MAG: CBS domain-containing protein [Thermoplasmata archaeon]|nr:CBS domain-containing protein [Thermoplasmata archaeon]
MGMEIGPERLKSARRKAEITQNHLAKLSGVSQSMIAKIESGIVDPSYKVMKELNDALFRKRDDTRRKAFEIMNPGLVSFSPDDPLDEAVNVLMEKGYSQAPVLKDGRPVGTISESSILLAIHDTKKKELRVMDAMGEALPTIPSSTSTESVLDLLKAFSAVLVVENGSIVGIITRTDLIRNDFVN